MPEITKLSLSDVLERLEDVRATGSPGEYRARCPNHPDTARSLHVVNEEGFTTIACRSGCDYTDICRRLDIEPLQLVPDTYPAYQRKEAVEGDGIPSDPFLTLREGTTSHAPFWYRDKKDRLRLKYTRFIAFLARAGFAKTYHGNPLESLLIRIRGNVIEEVSSETIKDYVHGYFLGFGEELLPDGEDPGDVYEMISRGATRYFSRSLLEFLPRVEPTFNRDTQTEAFIYYRNCAVRVTRTGFHPVRYADLDGLVWRSQIQDRDFIDMRHEDISSWEWHQHLTYVSGGDPDRHKALLTALGYLLHNYKDPSLTKAIIFIDEEISDAEEGRTGKSLTTSALHHLISCERFDARNFSFHDRFAWQTLDLSHDVADFNDAAPDFEFSRLFSAITDDMHLERKGLPRVRVPFSESPKFVITTNHTIQGQGASFEERVFQVEFSPYYKPGRQPRDIWGHRLFDDWSREEWARFDNIMLAAIRMFLDEGLHEYDHIHLPYKRLKNATSFEFAEWILKQAEGMYEKPALFASFRDAFHPDYEDLWAGTFTRWIKAFGRIYGYDVSEKWPGNKQLIRIRAGENAIERISPHDLTPDDPIDAVSSGKLQADDPEERWSRLADAEAEQASIWEETGEEEFPARSRSVRSSEERHANPQTKPPKGTNEEPLADRAIQERDQPQDETSKRDPPPNAKT